MAFAARPGSKAWPVTRTLWSTRSFSVVPSGPPWTYSTASQGSSTRRPVRSVGKAPVSMKRTTNGVGGTRSFKRPSAMASLRTMSPAVGPSDSTNAGRSTFTTTGQLPRSPSRVA
jgi:hypothetical protein